MLLLDVENRYLLPSISQMQAAIFAIIFAQNKKSQLNYFLSNKIIKLLEKYEELTSKTPYIHF